MIKELKYTIKKPFEYSYKGENIFCKEIVIKSPDYSYRKEAAIIKGEFLKSAVSFSKGSDDEEGDKKEKKLDKDEMKKQVSSMIAAYGDIEKAYKAFDTILLNKNGNIKMALIDNKEPLTELLISKMDISEYEYIFGSYVIDFLGIPLTT